MNHNQLCMKSQNTSTTYRIKWRRSTSWLRSGSNPAKASRLAMRRRAGQRRSKGYWTWSHRHQCCQRRKNVLSVGGPNAGEHAANSAIFLRSLQARWKILRFASRGCRLVPMIRQRLLEIACNTDRVESFSCLSPAVVSLYLGDSAEELAFGVSDMLVDGTWLDWSHFTPAAMIGNEPTQDDESWMTLLTCREGDLPLFAKCASHVRRSAGPIHAVLMEKTVAGFRRRSIWGKKSPCSHPKPFSKYSAFSRTMQHSTALTPAATSSALHASWLALLSTAKKNFSLTWESLLCQPR